jgi:trans-2,3-dihydro-3-hydroxyanthranilate isomerase
MPRLDYEIVDVFTERPFAGNQLAVVFGADGLQTGQMHAIAKEFNFSETIFVLPATTPEATYRVRIFTPRRELPFAGHPSVGAAVTQLRRGAVEPGIVTQECGAGLLPIEVTVEGWATLQGGKATVGAPLDPGPLLEVAGLSETDFAGPQPRAAGCGLEFPFLHVQPEALAKATLDQAAAWRHGIDDVAVFTWDGVAREARVRVFVPGMGIVEDPATGSAALGFGVWLVASGLLPGDGESAYVIHQGVEMGRPSTLACTVTAFGGAVTRATVSGHVAPVASGAIEAPNAS